MIKTVRWMDNYRPDLEFVSNSQDVKYIKEYLVGIGESRGFLKQFDSFFVQVGEGDYDEIWGMDGIVPHYEKDVYLLLSKSGTSNETQYARNPRCIKSNPMKLMTKEIKAKLPPLYSQEKNPDPIVWTMFFCPWNDWKWYAIEFDGVDTFFGMVHGHAKELGYFTLSEFQSVRGPGGLGIERDLYWRPVPLSQIK